MEEDFKKLVQELMTKGKEVAALHEHAKATAKTAHEAGSYQSQQTGALLAIAEALNVHNEFQMLGTETQLKVALEALEDL